MEADPSTRFPRRLFLVVALQALLMLATTILYPPFQEPDEAAHIDYVLAHREGVWLDGPGQRQLQSGVVAASELIGNTTLVDHIGAENPPPRGTRPSFDALGTAPSTTSLPDEMVQHPPLYYGLAAGFSYLLPEFSHRGFDVQIFWLRLLSLLLLLPVPILIFGAARRVTGSVDLALVATVIPLSVPSYLRTGASVTNDSLLVLLTTALLALVVRIAWGDRSRRTALMAGSMLGLALLTKGFALVLPVVLIGAYLIGPDSGSIAARWRRTGPPMVVAVALGSTIGAWWWVRNVVVYGAVQPDGYGPLPANLRLEVSGLPTPRGSDLGFIRAASEVVLRHMWGSLGLIDTPSLPLGVLLTVAIAAAALIVVALIHRDDAIGWRPGRAAVLIAPLVLTIATLYLGARHSYLYGQHLPGLQARYLVPHFLGVSLAIAVALGWLLPRRERWLTPLSLVGSLVFLCASAFLVLDVNLSAPVTGLSDRLHSGLRFASAWTPWSPAVTVVIVVALGAVTISTLAAFVVGGARTE